jgi:hypothetical protein
MCCYRPVQPSFVSNRLLKAGSKPFSDGEAVHQLAGAESPASGVRKTVQRNREVTVHAGDLINLSIVK